MDESTLGSLRHRVPILDGEYFQEWKNEMLVIFNEYHLNKYITSPCVGFWVPADPLGSNSGVHAEIAPPTYICLVASQGSKLHEEQH